METSKMIELNSKITEIEYLDSILNPIGELESISLNIMLSDCELKHYNLPFEPFEEPIKQLIRERIEQLKKEIEEV